MKTNGQLLYEHKYPTHIRVVPADTRHFATAADVIYMPVHQVPWDCLTKACRDGWERTSVGHHIFSTGESK